MRMAGATTLTAMAVRVILYNPRGYSLTERSKTKGYLLPNDEEEAERLDLCHEMTLTIMGRKLFLAPIGKSPQRVLDLATGTGIWAIQFGKATHLMSWRLMRLMRSE